MKPSLRILHVEDSADDAELVAFALRDAPFEAVIVRVDTEPGFVAQLEAHAPEVVICDFDMPRFTASRALEILQERRLEIPFILVSHHIGESAAVVAMQQGAGDYLPKGDLGRLPKAIEAGLERSRIHREKALVVESLRESELLQRGILDSLATRIALLEADGTIQAVNKLWLHYTNEVCLPSGSGAAAEGANYLAILDQRGALGIDYATQLAAGIRSVLARERPSFSLEYELAHGSLSRWYSARVMPLDGSSHGAVVSHRDITDRVITTVALHAANKRLRNLSKRMLTVQEEERRAMSRDLHDDVSQTLGALKIGLHRLSQVADPDQAGLVAECLAAASAALDRLRQLAQELRPPQLDQLGLEDALRWLAERQSAATGLDVHCTFTGSHGKRTSAVLESACYRITQEALSNATRHAQAKSVSIALDQNAELLKLNIHDDGVGFDQEAARAQVLKTGSMGLIGMEERAQLAGGRLKVRSVLGGGCTVSAIFPVDPAPDDSYVAGLLESAM